MNISFTFAMSNKKKDIKQRKNNRKSNKIKRKDPDYVTEKLQI